MLLKAEKLVSVRVPETGRTDISPQFYGNGRRGRGSSFDESSANTWMWLTRGLILGSNVYRFVLQVGFNSSTTLDFAMYQTLVNAYEVVEKDENYPAFQLPFDRPKLKTLPPAGSQTSGTGTSMVSTSPSPSKSMTTGKPVSNAWMVSTASVVDSVSDTEANEGDNGALPIVLGVVGGLCVLVLLVMLGAHLMKRRRIRAASKHSHLSKADAMALDKFGHAAAVPTSAIGTYLPVPKEKLHVSMRPEEGVEQHEVNVGVYTRAPSSEFTANSDMGVYSSPRD